MSKDKSYIVMRRLFILLLSTIPLCVGAVNSLSLSSASGHPGDVITMEASMSGAEEVVACEWRIPLGQHLSYVAHSVTLNTTRSDGHSVTAATYQDTLIVSIYSIALHAISGTEGVLFSFQLTLGREPATYTIVPEALLSNASGNSVSSEVQSGKATILSPKISVTTPQVDFGHIPIRISYTRTIQIENVGNEDLHISNAILSAPELSLPQSEWTIAPGVTQSIVLTYNPMVRGAMTETIRFRSDAINDADVYQANRVTIMADPFSVNELRVIGAEGIADDTVSVSLRVNNMEPLVGVQCSFKLPTALEYVPNSASVSTRSANHSIVSTISHDTLTVVLYSIFNETLEDNDGDVLSFKLRLNGTSGNYALNPIGVMLSNITLENMTSASYNASVRINSPRLSAPAEVRFGSTPVTEQVTAQYTISNQGKVSLVVDKINFLKDGFSVQESLPLNIAQGQSKTITLSYSPSVEGDYSTTMQVYSNDPIDRMHSVSLSGKIFEPNTVSLSGELTQDGYLMHVFLDNYSNIVGFQMDMGCWKGMQPQLQKTNRLEDHISMMYALSDSTYRILAYSPVNKTVSDHSGELFAILFQNTDVPSYNHTLVILDSILLSDNSNRQRLTSRSHVHTINEQRRITTTAEHGTILISGSTPESTVKPVIKLVTLPDVPFEFDYNAIDFDASTATIANHPDAVLADYNLKLTGNIPTMNDSSLTISTICKGYIDKWAFESTASGTYFARRNQDNMTIICKAAPQLGSNNASDFISNRGRGYNYMFRIGERNSWYLHTGTAYSASRALTLADNAPQILVCRVNGTENYIQLDNYSTGESKRVSGVNWGGTNTIFKFFYNDNNEYFRGDFYWAYYSFNYLSDENVQQVIDYHNNVSQIPSVPPSADSCMYDYGSILHLSAVPNEGFNFYQWADGNTDNPRKVTVTEDAEYVALFREDIITKNEQISKACPQIQKIFRNGQIYILRGEKVYTVTGQEVK